jgi:hypothetical protein
MCSFQQLLKMEWIILKLLHETVLCQIKFAIFIEFSVF